MDIIKRSRIDGLVDSLIALQQQAEKLQTIIGEGTQRWAGQRPKDALRDTAKAMLNDAGTLQDLQGADEWSEKYKQAALAILRDMNDPSVQTV